MKIRLTAAFGLAALLTIGCQDSTDTPAPAVMAGGENEGHKHAESLKEAVEELVGMRNTIRDGFANEDPDAAHGPLHEVVHVLDEAEALAEKESLEPEKLDSVRDAIEVLKEQFGSVDAMMHGDEGSEYSEVAEKVDGAVAVLVEVSGADPEGSTHEDGHDHDEDGHDHGEDGHDHGEDGHDHGEDGHDHDEDGHDHDEK